ncbi:exopolyphosphatase [Andreprevotia lacus DSM 23236]|jgi:exopolyphosphatase/guanosine-5'-triphosphate,3'-diphosphate pyrophosphatase|uniref:Exopolyphosphatase n=1 Tax=Andreprevotia lacus DSM 23236 TaxID=1121001 RepID=A0A1W1Y1M6_9NEIS|nr:Ppx/GppA family phosphatase [Andreprevotia lacus]SMC29701.1 exopolyphosphatase [Andreprevotia lacus DSM 23236]
MQHPKQFAAVDLGSNSFRLQIARNDHGRPHPLITLKETVRLAAGLNEDGHLVGAVCDEALAALTRFGARLAGIPPHQVRVVATNTFRVAANIDDFLPRAEAALGFPINIIDGHEEARLIYLGAAHSLTDARDPRLVIDIGGGSTEIIVGRGFDAHWMASIQLGCVTWSQRYFPDGVILPERMAQAEAACRAALAPHLDVLLRHRWEQVIGTSGTARSLADVVQLNGFGSSQLTPAALAVLRQVLIEAGHVDRVQLQGLRADRRPVLAGGLSIMAAVFEALALDHMDITLGGLRDGVMYDLLARAQGGA